MIPQKKACREGIGVALHVLGDTLFDSVVDARHQGWQEGVG